MEFISIGFQENLNQKVSSLAIAHSILVYPTRIAASIATGEFIAEWDLAERNFISVEELQEILIVPHLPVLTDEKRLLCLYLAMGEAHREFFHILTYSDIVDWGKRFFDFFEELADECVEVDSLLELNDSGTFHLQEWQHVYLTRLLAIRSEYYNYIASLGFSDPMFFKTKDNIYVPWKNSRVIFVNQYYYSALERAQIVALEASQNQVFIVSQGLIVSNASGAWKMQCVELGKSWESLSSKPDIKVLETENETQMALALLAWQHDKQLGNCAIIDSSFHSQPYSRYFPEQRFAMPSNYPFSQSSIYKMLSAMAQGIKAVNESGGFLPIRLLANWMSTSWFMRYFVSCSEAEYASIEICAKNELATLIDADYLYVDTKLFSNGEKGYLQTVVEGFYRLLEAFGNVDTIAGLCDLLDSPKGLELNRILNATELTYTDTIACFWSSVANFLSIEKLSLIKYWHAVFAQGEIGQNLLELLLSYLKSTCVSYQKVVPDNPDWEISNLLDSRNRSFDTVALFQMVEGIIPSKPTPVWLFSEAQRARLGLKTYDEIRSWERYYFFRLLFTSKQALCFCYRNAEQDINPSSFLGELEQVMGQSQSNEPLFQIVHIPVSSIYKEFGFYPESQDPELCSLETIPPAEFFTIPCEVEQDFPRQQADFGASSLIGLLKNPFIWFVEQKSKLRHQDWEAVETISPKLFGNIMHAYFASILGELQGRHIGLERLEAIFGDRELLESELQKLIISRRFRYQIPKNYNADFLSEIIAKALSESLYRFYHDWVQKNLDRSSFTLIPETEAMSEAEKDYKTLGTVYHDGKEYILRIRGKADLRIETDNQVYIVDFKTGNHDVRQLILYEWFYYLLDELFPENDVHAVFWNILDADSKPVMSKPEKRQQLKEDIKEIFLAMLCNGYTQGQKASDRNRLIKITRADLLKAKREVTDAS